MKFRLFTISALVLLLTAACSTEEDFEAPRMEGVLSATVDQPTRAGFDQSGAFYWSTKDQIAVNTTGQPEMFTSLNLTTGGGTSSATFKGTMNGSFGEYAVYPYSDCHSVTTEGVLTYNLPAEYTYAKVDADFFTPEQGEGNSFNPAMWGKIENSSVRLQHLGGVLCVKYDRLDVASGSFQLMADKKINGDFQVDLKNATPELKTVAKGTEDNIVTISFSNADPNASGVFYVPVPVGSYLIRVKILDDAREIVSNTPCGTYNVTRRLLKKIEIKHGSLDVTVPESVSTVEQVKETLKTKDAVLVTEEIRETKAIEIPETATPEASSAKTVQLEKVASGASVAISDASTDPGKSVKEFTLSIPHTENTAPLAADINMPNTTVKLAANAGKATFGTVTAATAENTLVIESGVTVNRLIVKKGNVRISKGAKVLEIQRASENPNVVIILKEQGVANPEKLGENCIIKDADVDDLKQALLKGEKYTLKGDMTVDMSIQDMWGEIDLNHHTLSLNYDLSDAACGYKVAEGKSLKISNGNISGTVSDKNHTVKTIANKAILGTKLTSSLILEGVVFTTNATAVFSEGAASKVLVLNSRVTCSDAGYCLGTNASTGKTNKVNIELKNSDFTAGTAVYMNVPGQLLMDNCNVKGTGFQGMFLRGGKATIKNSDIQLVYPENETREEALSMSNYFADRDWGTGNMLNLAALTVGNKNDPSYNWSTEVSLVNTKLHTEGVHAELFPALYVWANPSNSYKGYKGVTLEYDDQTTFSQAGKVSEPMIGCGVNVLILRNGVAHVHDYYSADRACKLDCKEYVFDSYVPGETYRLYKASQTPYKVTVPVLTDHFDLSTSDAVTDMISPNATGLVELNHTSNSINLFGKYDQVSTWNGVMKPLYVKAGTEINVLDIRRGTAHIEKGAIVHRVISTTDKIVGLTFDDGAVVEQNEIPTERLDAEYLKLHEVITSGGSMTLSKDMTYVFDNPKYSEKWRGDIDLDGHTLTIDLPSGAQRIRVHEDLTLKNGKIIVLNSEVDQPLFNVESSLTFNLQNLEITTKGCPVMNPMESRIIVNITDCILDVGESGAYVLTTNATTDHTPEINITGSTLKGETPILLNVSGTLTMTGSHIFGRSHGVIMRGGTATMTNCDIHQTYTAADAADVAQNYVSKNWGQGNDVNLGALIMGNKGDGKAYQYPTSVTLVNTTVSTEGANAALFPSVYVWANAAEGKGVTFNYDAQSQFKGGQVVYGNKAANITVNGAPAVQPGK